MPASIRDQLSPHLHATPSVARIYDYWLGGKNFFPVDKHAADQIATRYPHPERVALANRQFHQQAAARLVRWGIDQIIDLGCGLPTNANTHDVVRLGDRRPRVVYTDNDPTVMAHVRALLCTNDDVIAIPGDARDPAAILANPELRAHIDLRRPCALLATAVMHFVPDADRPHHCIATLMDAFASGSFLVLTHGTSDGQPSSAVTTVIDTYADATAQLHPRSYAEVARFFRGGLDLVPPYPHQRPDLAQPLTTDNRLAPLWCGIAHKR